MGRDAFVIPTTLAGAKCEWKRIKRRWGWKWEWQWSGKWKRKWNWKLKCTHQGMGFQREDGGLSKYEAHEGPKGPTGANASKKR